MPGINKRSNFRRHTNHNCGCGYDRVFWVTLFDK